MNNKIYYLIAKNGLIKLNISKILPLKNKILLFLFFLFLTFCKKSHSDSEIIENIGNPEILNGVWGEYRNSSDINHNNNIQFTGSYIKFKIKSDKIIIWHLYGSDLRLEEYGNMKCVDNKCMPEERLGDYDHFFVSSSFVLVNDDNFFIVDPEGTFPTDKESRYLRLEESDENFQSHPSLKSLIEQSEVDLPESKP